MKAGRKDMVSQTISNRKPIVGGNLPSGCAKDSGLFVGRRCEMLFRMNLSEKAGDDRVHTGYQETFDAPSEEEARADYFDWLLTGGFTEESLAGRILCDPMPEEVTDATTKPC